MSAVLISELPQMLVDEQRADACSVKYRRPEDVFDLDKWDALVRAACTTGGLPTTDGCMANIVDVNDWLTTGDPGLWSAFQLHNPLLSDMDGMFESDNAALPAAIKERISLIFRFNPWDSLSPQERWDKVSEIDALNTPKCRLRFALRDVLFWGERIGPLQTLSAAAERELQEWESLLANHPSEKDLRDRRIGEIQQWVNRIESLKDLMLIGCISDTDEFGEFVKLLQEAKNEPWCRNVRLPVWLGQFSCAASALAADEKNSKVMLASQEFKPPTASDHQPEIQGPVITPRKLEVMVTQLRPIWPNIENDINNGHKNELRAQAKLPAHGKWNMAEALKWAIENRPIKKDKAVSIVANDPTSELSVLLAQMLNL